MTRPNMAHRIRLRKPWQRSDHSVRPGVEKGTAHEKASADSHESVDVHTYRVDVPDRLPLDSAAVPAGANFVHHVIYRRQFHRPSGIESGERVLLEVGAAAGRVVEIRVNAIAISSENGADEHALDEHAEAPLRLNLSGRLADHNELEIELESTADSPGPPRLIGEVNLWIVESE